MFIYAKQIKGYWTWSPDLVCSLFLFLAILTSYKMAYISAFSDYFLPLRSLPTQDL